MDPRTIKYSLTSRFLPFINWFPELKNKKILRADIIAGIAVAMTLIPHGMAYATLAGLPVYYGLYAALLPPVIASLFGSSRQLATGPVVIISLLTATTLSTLVAPGASDYIFYALLLALLAGLIQLSLGLLKLGAIVNFLSHPVVLGFTYAAIIIIATSQLDKLFGVDVDRTSGQYHYHFVWETLIAITRYIHWPALLLGLLAIAIMTISKLKNPKLPCVLLAVIITTLLSAWFNFHEETTVKIDNIIAAQTTSELKSYIANKHEIKKLESDLVQTRLKHAAMEQEYGDIHSVTLAQKNKITVTRSELEKLSKTNTDLFNNLKRIKFGAITDTKTRQSLFYSAENTRFKPSFNTDGWSVKNVIQTNTDLIVTFERGGKIVQDIPAVLPAFKLPGAGISDFNWGIILSLLPMALIIALIGFMESLSIAKVIASRTRQTIDTNQELVGQGLANTVGSFFQSYAVSGSFTRSSINLSTGAVTGFSAIVASLVVVLTLMFFTSLFYHLPQTTLAAIIIVAAFNLSNLKTVKQTWLANRHDGIVMIATFGLTLIFAPHLEIGLFIGVALSLVLFLWRTMAPRLVTLAKDKDNNFHDARSRKLPTCDEIALLRFEGSLYFANTSYLEDKILQLLTRSPNLRFIIIDGVSINEVDASGEEILREICQRMQTINISVLFARFKQPILDMFERTHFISEQGREHFFRKPELALEYAWDKLEENHKEHCPLYAYQKNIQVAQKLSG